MPVRSANSPTPRQTARLFPPRHAEIKRKRRGEGTANRRALGEKKSRACEPGYGCCVPWLRLSAGRWERKSGRPRFDTALDPQSTSHCLVMVSPPPASFDVRFDFHIVILHSDLTLNIERRRRFPGFGADIASYLFMR